MGAEEAKASKTNLRVGARCLVKGELCDFFQIVLVNAL